jgi:hypothetical protein
MATGQLFGGWDGLAQIVKSVFNAQFFPKKKKKKNIIIF